ncbi:hypothetical protein OJF2_76130 [Aquisphaera giovannonii]|uniref:Uncharacterized protein n=1 Tax=Aquisphaera giovannonii TaxID=406548 RepID=A0A5B9WG65_9BACT|nr:hypothetical protein [Aquisphaera giovannonii]QEH39001.1 hypothetical protein OJF2_76130 [Aquisphaera giovannonii]
MAASAEASPAMRPGASPGDASVAARRSGGKGERWGVSLVHSRTFRITNWHSEEFGSHYEVEPDEEGDYDFFCTIWSEPKRHCERFGVMPEV